jgi:hypothetical protein
MFTHHRGPSLRGFVSLIIIASFLSANAQEDIGVAAVPANVRITIPHNGVSSVEGMPITLTAAAEPAALSIEFLANGRPIGSGLAAQKLSTFTQKWTGVSPGDYKIVAVAQDSTGARATSAPVSIKVIAQVSPAVGFQLMFYAVGSNPKPTNLLVRSYLTSENAVLGPGPLLPGVRLVPDPIDEQSLYGVYHQKLYKVSRRTGAVQPWQPPATLPALSWPAGVASDTKRRRVIVATLGGEGYLYSYTSKPEKWELIGSMHNRDIKALVYNADDDSLYALETSGTIVDHLNLDGTLLGTISLPRLPAASKPMRSELIAIAGIVAVITEPELQPGQFGVSYIQTINLRTGIVALSAAAASHLDEPFRQIQTPIAEGNEAQSGSASVSLLRITREAGGGVQIEGPAGTALETTTNLSSPWLPVTNVSAANAQFFRGIP